MDALVHICEIESLGHFFLDRLVDTKSIKLAPKLSKAYQERWYDYSCGAQNGER